MTERANTESVIEIVQYLLDCDPDVKLQKWRGVSLFRYACMWEYNDSNIDAALEVIKAIYDAHPEAIEDDIISSHNQDFHQEVQAFINKQLI